MKFEYNREKSRANKEKHGIDFEQAKKLWLGDTIELSARDKNEVRSLVIGRISAVYWSAIVTRRGRTIRIISVRRARDEEKEIYKKG